ncbi:MAG: homing endonuclease associated repeat-containing protein [Armatimonadota bacterium]
MRNAKWSEDSIIKTLVQLHKEGVDLSYSGVTKTHLALLRAAMRRFGSWRAAVEAARIPYSGVRKYRDWSRERIIARIRELHDKGEDLSWGNISVNVDPQLAAASTKPKHFGSWREAVEAAGIDYDSVRRYTEWSEELIITRLKRLHADGHPLNARAIELLDMPLVTAARRRFESWEKALYAAGIDGKRYILRRPSRRRRTE